MGNSNKKPVLNKNLTKPGSIVRYGTAGYRLKEPDLNNVICRASFIAYIRSATFAGKYIGLYITASHNPGDYNGVKFIDFNGNMLDESWEIASDDLVNAEDCDFVPNMNKILRQISNYKNINETLRANVIIGRDTRESGIELNKNIKEVLSGYKCNVLDYGIVSCPEMHFLIRKCNETNSMVDKGEYLNHLYNKYTVLKNLTGQDNGVGIDTANGVGKIKIEEMMEIDQKMRFEILNEPENNILNKNCGADFMKVNNIIPKLKPTEHKLRASFDGDVDRLMLFDSNSRIFDGDAQAVFIAEYMKEKLEKENLSADIGVVLSHYSNMGAIKFLQNKGFRVTLAQTGVKNFVKESKKYDIGIYFEPNGHGSVTFSKRFLERVDTLKNNSIIKLLTQIFDPCVGDALANLLFFKTTLLSTSELKKYTEMHSRLMTVTIKDKNLLKVDQNNIVSSPDIQKLIDESTLKFDGRAFVRPSGTEDLVRVFAECKNVSDCDKLALKVAQIVYDNCEGTGPHPEISYKN